MCRKTITGLAGAWLLISALIASGSEGPVEFRRSFVDGRYGQIHVLTSSPKSHQAPGTALACFAPNPAAGRYYRMFMAELGRDRVMIAPDYPGLGQSDPPPAIPGLADLAGAMADALDALGYGQGGKGQVDVCGYHTGAMVAVEMAVARPDLVRRLLLLGIPWYDAAGRAVEYENNVVEKPLNEDLGHLQDVWDFTVTHRNDGVTLERGYENFVDVLTARPYRPWIYAAVFTYAAEERAPLVRQPVLILNTHGSLAEQTRAMAPMFTNAELIEIPELHHGIFDVGPKILADHARPFLDRP